MPKVTFSSAKGILQEAGSGFQVNDVPISTESETFASTRQVTITPILVDDDVDGTVIDIADAWFTLPTPNRTYYIWFDGGEEEADDPADSFTWLDSDNAIRISDVTGDGEQLATAAAVCAAITDRVNSAAASAGGINYSTNVDGDADNLDNVLGQAGLGGSSATGAGDHSGELFAVDNGDSTVTIHCLEMGDVPGSGDLDFESGGLLSLGEDEDQDWTAAVDLESSGTKGNGNALQVFGTSLLRSASAAAENIRGDATLAVATAGTKKFLHMDTDPTANGEAPSVRVTLNDFAGSETTLTLDTENDFAWLLSNGVGWIVLDSEVA